MTTMDDTPADDSAGPTIEQVLEEAWGALVAGDPAAPGLPQLEVQGAPGDAGLPSRLPVAEAAVACIGLALGAAACLSEQASGRRPALSLSPGHVGAAVVSERHFRIGDRPAGSGFAPLSRFWPTADGWIRTHANYPWHRAALLQAVGATGSGVEEVGEAVRSLPSGVMEERVVAAGGVAAMVRSAAEWAAHDQGRALGDEPLIGRRSVPGAPARRRSADGAPAAGVRVLDLTRVIAGPVCTRYLGALGADVLRVDPPARPDFETESMADTLLGKRSAVLDLNDPRGHDHLHRLLAEADVLVAGYRPGSLDRFGLSFDQLSAAHPGLVVVFLSAWGHSGPWASRRGFDSIVQAASGIAVTEATDGGMPGALPCQLLDHGTGYLAAAAALDGLRRQRAYGGTEIRTLSLARTAAWLMAQGTVDEHPSPATPDSGRWLAELGDAEPVRAVDPPGAVDGPLRWRAEPARYLQDPPTWTDTPV